MKPYEPVVRPICGVDFVFPDYKEPLVQLKGAVKGYMRGTLPYAASDGRLPCAFCDPLTTWDQLGNHARLTHGLSAREYRDRLGLLRSSSLCSRRLRVKLAYSVRSNAGIAHFTDSGRPRPSRAMVSAGRVAAENSPERLNKKGICRDQIIAVARKIANENGGVLTAKALNRQHVWPDRGALRKAGFADIDTLAAEIGATVPKRLSLTDAEMLDGLRAAAQELGRTPRTVDLRGAPSASRYIKRFGSWTEACERAGLSPNLSPPVSEGDEVDILNTYAMTGNTEAVVTVTHRSRDRVSQVLAKYGVGIFRPHLGVERQKAREWAAEVAQRLAS